MLIKCAIVMIDVIGLLIARGKILLRGGRIQREPVIRCSWLRPHHGWA
jgi:hypothetical protein